MVFPTFFNLSLNFTVSSSWSEPQSATGQFCWLYRASSSWVSKNKINLTSVLIIWWCPSVELSLVLLEEGCLLWSVHSPGKILLAFALFYFVLQGQTFLLLKVSLDSSMMKRTPFIGVLWRSCRSSLEPFNFIFFSISGWGIDLDYSDIEWFALKMNWDHSVIFEIAPKYCISDSFVDYDGYSIPSKGFLPAVVDIMVIWMKFTHSRPF